MLRAVRNNRRGRGLPATVLAAVLAAVLAVTACTGGGNDRGAPEAGPDCDPSRPATPGRVERTLTFAGDVRQYALSVPASYDGATAAPLIVNLHGLGSTAEVQDKLTGLPEAAGARGYVVVSPQAEPLRVPVAEAFSRAAFWNVFGSGKVAFEEPAPAQAPDAGDVGPDDVGFLSELVDALAARLCIDEDRIYATGLSNGAGMATTLACERNRRFAAVAAVSGVNLTGVCAGRGPESVLAIHGDADRIVAYEGNGLLGFHLGNPSVPDRMAAWGRRDGCRMEPQDEVRAPGVTVTRWEGCRQDADVVLWTLAGVGHVWPRGVPIDATTVVLDFFDRHRR